jgi:hypothetical protein
MIANVAAGQTYTMSVTVGDGWFEHVGLWIDFDNNGFDASDYIGEIGDGGVGVTTEGPVTIPAGVAAGQYRMRVKLNAGPLTNDPCDEEGVFGETEDYTLDVGIMAVSQAGAKDMLTVYPNPVVDIANIVSGAKVRSVKVYDISGKQVSNMKVNDAKTQVDMSRLTTGTYVLNIETDNGTQSVKVIKK